MPVKKSDDQIPKSPLERFRQVFTDLKAPKGGLPTMPTRISETSLDELGDMIARYTAWREFTEDRHLESVAVYSQLKSEYDLASDKAMLSSIQGTITEKKAAAKTSSTVSILAKKTVEAEIYMNLLGGKLDSFSNVLAMLSRELTRRGVYNG